MVMGGGSCSEGRGFKSWRHILDGHDIFSLIWCKNCTNVCLKRPKINKKEAGVGPFKKQIAYPKINKTQEVLYYKIMFPKFFLIQNA